MAGDGDYVERGTGEDQAKTVLADETTKNKKEDNEPEMSEEDLKKKEELETIVERIKDGSDAGVQANALSMLKEEIRTSTGSMTAVPKALKFVGPFYQDIKTALETTSDANKKDVCDLLSYLGTIHGAEGACECLHFKLQGSTADLDTWGHEFVNHLCAEVSNEYSSFMDEEKDVSHLAPIVDMVLPYLFQHNSEPEAVDLLMDTENVAKLVEFADETNYKRLCIYLLQCANYVPEPEDNEYRKVVVDIYQKLSQHADALRVAMAMHDLDLVTSIFEPDEEAVGRPDDLTKKQLAYMIAESHIHVEAEEEELEEIIGNCMLTDNYLALAKDLDVMEAKTPEDIYKSHLSSGRSSNAPDSARQNLANTFVNGFVNAGYGQDKLLSSEGANKWFYRNQEHGMMSAAASLGMIHLWDVTTGLNSIINYLKASEDYIKAGALMGIGIVSAGVRTDCDPVFALIDEELNKPNVPDIMKTGGIVGVAIAYAGTNEETVQELLLPMIEDSEAPIDIVSLAALSLGLVFVGSTNSEIATAIIQVFMLRSEDSSFKHSTLSRFLCLGLGLLYLGKQEEMEVTMELLQAIENKSLAKYATNTLVSCAYAGTGNVLQVQKLLHLCGEHNEEKKDDKEGAEAEGAQADDDTDDFAHQTVGAMGLALVAFGEEIGSEMAIRTCDHMLQYGDPAVRRGVPLALALLSISNPDLKVTDTLSKLSHDSDTTTSQCAILGLGLVAAGTNNARVATTLRQLATFYAKEAQHLFMVNIAQGLLHMGKGLLSLSPFHSDRLLKSTVALSGILAVLHAAVDMKGTLLGKHHYLMYFLVCAIKPNMLITIDAEGNQLPVSVRVGKAVDTVGQAGKPKTITGFQTYTTPVLIGHGERAELATDEYIPVSNTLEGIVILQVNPDSKDAKNKEEAKDTKKRAGPVYSARADLTW
jgi:26S proteasome regulatory subunit N1